jgi:hypothetical protein
MIWFGTKGTSGEKFPVWSLIASTLAFLAWGWVIKSLAEPGGSDWEDEVYAFLALLTSTMLSLIEMIVKKMRG